MSSTIYVFLGASGAGKDTAAEIIEVPNVKWTTIIKETLENWYKLPKGSFNDREFRENYILPNGKTPLQILIELMECWNKVDPLLTARPTMQKVIASRLKQGLDVCFTDTRRAEEAELIMEAAKKYKAKVVVIYIKGGKTLPSDNQLLNIVSYFNSIPEVDFYTVINDYGESFRKDILDVKMTY
jgi:predicted kinase